MTKLKSLSLITSLALALASPSWAQVYACQFTMSSGFKFEAGSWASAIFKTRQPFFIALKDGQISTESAVKVLDSLPEWVRCDVTKVASNPGGVHHCSDYASQFVFSPENGTGALSKSLGSATRGPSRDTVSVSLFTCQRM
jgi:hypothetical protein